MKKIFLLLVTIITLAGCGNDDSSMEINLPQYIGYDEIGRFVLAESETLGGNSIINSEQEWETFSASFAHFATYDIDFANNTVIAVVDTQETSVNHVKIASVREDGQGYIVKIERWSNPDITAGRAYHIISIPKTGAAIHFEE